MDLVRGRVALTRRGGRWVGRCPFHEERTPSFSLLPPDARRYYCHGCGATGDAFDWMQQQEGAAGFSEAVIALAERFGIDIAYAEESPGEAAARTAREARAALLERAAAYYAEYLWRAADAEPAREYLASRGIREELIRRFRIGYAPADGDKLSRSALAHGFTRDQLEQAGLARARGRRLADFFHGRITFPIADARGRVQGFGARTLDPNERAKYVNSPEGPHFQKRHLLFGLAEARATAAREGRVVVVEGYTDVLALVDSGVEAAVACMGTSLTPEQLRLLNRWAGEVTLCFDGDRAGQQAAWRSVEASRGIPLTFTAVSLPPGRDPGDIARDAAGREELARLIGAPEPLVGSLIRARIARTGRSPREREEALEAVAGLLRHLPDASVEKDEGVRVAAGLLQLSPALEERLRASSREAGARRRGAPQQTPAAAAPRAASPQEVRERSFLAMAVALPREAGDQLQSLPPDAFMVDEHRRAFELLRAGEADPERWPDELRSLSAALLAEAATGTPTPAVLRECADRLRLPVLRRHAADLREAGDEEGSLRALDLARRVEASLRGDL